MTQQDDQARVESYRRRLKSGVMQFSAKDAADLLSQLDAAKEREAEFERIEQSYFTSDQFLKARIEDLERENEFLRRENTAHRMRPADNRGIVGEPQ